MSAAVCSVLSTPIDSFLSSKGVWIPRNSAQDYMEMVQHCHGIIVKTCVCGVCVCVQAGAKLY